MANRRGDDDDVKISFQPKGVPLKGRTPTPARTPTPTRCRTPTPNKPLKPRTPTPRGTNAPPPARRAEVFAKVELRKVAVAASEVHATTRRASPLTNVPWPEPPPKATDTGVTFPVYERALELAALSYAIIERSDGERYYIRDQLDRKSTDVPQLVSRALAAADMAARRDLYVQARGLVGDISSILDMLATRRTIAREAIEPARALARVLGAELASLAVPPPRVY